MNPPILPWHHEAAKEILRTQATGYHGADMNDKDAAAIIAAHDPHAAQQQETVRLLRRAEAALYAAPYPEYEKLSDKIRAHIAAQRGGGGAT
jgi:predicted signal transduction protein with EAL and GGDEF domain